MKKKMNDENEDGRDKKKGARRVRRRDMHSSTPKTSVCFFYAATKNCPFETSQEAKAQSKKCAHSHDLDAYMKDKPEDIHERCYIWDVTGSCRYGLTCRFGRQSHIKGADNIIDEERGIAYEKAGRPMDPLNVVPKDFLHRLDRNPRPDTRKGKNNQRNKKPQGNTDARNEIISFPKSKQFIEQWEKEREANRSAHSTKEPSAKRVKLTEDDKMDVTVDTPVAAETPSEEKQKEEVGSTTQPVVEEKVEEKESKSSLNIEHQDTMEVDPYSIELEQLRERSRQLFKNKLYLAPLTTVGNLPYRRVCKEFGADITCGEMALGMKLIQGAQTEWALLKRDPTEDIFGVQVCGAHADVMSQTAEVLSKPELGLKLDFIDINCGCPIDLVTRAGAGSALPERKTKFEGVIRGMTTVLREYNIPVTVKMRTGKSEKENTTHLLLENIKNWGAVALTLHGRSRLQRYARLADWNYIKSCSDEGNRVGLPIIGNGDLYTWKQVEEYKALSGVDTVMIARGALIKPWIFQEIKEQRDIDLSSGERFEMLKRFVNYGLYHWGSDDKGVNNTREFLLQWLSFLYRYIPVGILEGAAAMKDRPPSYFGRNDLETLMASPEIPDWIKISEMLLGPAPENFQFQPKHKAGSTNSEG
eukprot:TRINITY_DN18482_c0_g1_i1.p1 TRINITY_DN18482_c0_g1~~TRINITY_DN18482_c0_g1_i1.p1  ORF type:complete len:643 (+),score=116.53 TRINITY_DN18482_c0_g1_i1:469-2397(+)